MCWFCQRAGKWGSPCACQVLPTAMCDCIALTDMLRTGLDCFNSFQWWRAWITWTRKWSIHLKKVYLCFKFFFFFFFYKLWLILSVERKIFEAFSRQRGTVQGVSTRTNWSPLNLRLLYPIVFCCFCHIFLLKIYTPYMQIYMSQ